MLEIGSDKQIRGYVASNISMYIILEYSNETSDSMCAFNFFLHIESTIHEIFHH